MRSVRFAVLLHLGASLALAAPSLELETVDVTRLPELSLGFAAHDSAGEPLGGLRSAALRLFLDGQPLDGFTVGSAAQRQKCAVLFVVENSAHVRGRDFFELRSMVNEIAERLGPSDRVGLLSVSDQVTPQSQLTQDKSAL